jgi:hypothetical protein
MDSRHCEGEQVAMPPGNGFCVRGTQNLFTSDAAIQPGLRSRTGLPRYARNDERKN